MQNFVISLIDVMHAISVMYLYIPQERRTWGERLSLKGNDLVIFYLRCELLYPLKYFASSSCAYGRMQKNPIR
jgi:hypothetical protein